MNRKNFFFAALFTVVGLLCSCKPGVPSDCIGEDELEDILYDYHLAQAMAERKGDSVNYYRRSYAEAVFQKYGITEAEFDSSMVWYSKHATYLNEIYKRLNERLEADMKALGAQGASTDAFAQLTAQGDTANIWHDQAFLVLRPEVGVDRYHFTLNADTSFYKGDEMLWRFRSKIISNYNQNEVYAGLWVRYDNDSVAAVTQPLFSNNKAELRIKGDTARSIKQVNGFVYLRRNEKVKDFRMVTLTDIALVRMHRQVPKVDSTQLKADSIAQQDSLKIADSTQVKKLPGERMSPTELRDSRPNNRTINVVKEKPYNVVRSTNRRRK